MTYLLAVLAALLVAAGYFLGARRGRSREAAIKTTLDERSEKLTLAEHELLRRSSIDPVTELPTQQYFQDFLEREWRRSSRERTTVSLIMIEIDHFRAYRERLGKPDADACLRAVADAMRTIIHRPGDTLASYGGSGKFGVVLGGTDAKGAMLLAERLRQSVEKLQKSHPASPSGAIVTLSIGVAAAMPDREGAWQDIELIAMAENSLSQAKDTGRNRVSLDRASQPAASG